MSPYRHVHPLLGLRPWRQHSRVLAVGGAVYFMVGLAYLLTPITPTRATSLVVPLQWADIEVWGCVFIVVGLLAFVSTRWPITSERWGYVVMSSLSALWGMFHLSAMFLGAPVSGSIIGFLAWSLLGFLWWAISGLRNPEDLIAIRAAPTEGA